MSTPVTTETATTEEPGPPLAQGTFALWTLPDGGLLFVANVTDGPHAGTHRQRIPPQILNSIKALAGGSKIGALKGLFGIGKKD